MNCITYLIQLIRYSAQWRNGNEPEVIKWSYFVYLSLNCFFNPSESIGVSVTKQIEFERELRDGQRDINSSAACSVSVGDSHSMVTVLAVALHPKQSQNVYVITVRIGVPNSIGA